MTARTPAGDAVRLYRAALAAVDGRPRTREAVAALDLSEPVAAVAIGKAAGAMLTGAADALGPRLRHSLVVTAAPYLDERLPVPGDCEVVLSAHPLPDARSLAAGRALLRFIDRVVPGHSLVVLLSGGTSAMVEALPEGVTPADLSRLNAWLIGSGLPIEQINAVRCAVSLIKGGRLLHRVDVSRCRVLAISDVRDDRPENIGSGPLHPASRPLPDRLPGWIETLCRHAPAPPDDAAAVPTRVIATASDALGAAAAAARESGYRVAAMQRDLYGDVETLAERICRPVDPGVWLHVGEPVVRLPERPGRGGRCQHLAVLLARAIAGRPGDVFLCAGTDGLDGAGAAGAVVDGDTLSRAEAAGFDVDRTLAEAASGDFLASAEALLPARSTGTNVTDIVVRIATGP